METDQQELLITLSSLLEQHDIPYMITGAWSVIFYGRPRASHDIDFVVDIQEEQMAPTLATFQSLPTEYLIDVDMIEQAIQKRDMFQLIHLPTMLKFDLWLLKNDAFDRSRFHRRKRVKILDQIMTIASAEDTILQKLRWYKQAKIEKHFVDAAFVYQMQKDHLDMTYLRKWIQMLGVKRYFNQLEKVDLEQHL